MGGSMIFATEIVPMPNEFGCIAFYYKDGDSYIPLFATTQQATSRLIKDLEPIIKSMNLPLDYYKRKPKGRRAK